MDTTLPHPVVYFNQHLGAAHPKGWLKYAFSMFFVQERKKKQEN